jgi:hypothetical protein
MDFLKNVAKGATVAEKDATVEQQEMQKAIMVLNDCMDAVFQADGHGALSKLTGKVEDTISTAVDRKARYMRLSNEQKLAKRDEFKKQFKTSTKELCGIAEQLVLMCPQLSKEALERIRESVERHYDKEFRDKQTARVQELIAVLTAARDRGDEAGLRDAWCLLSSLDAEELALKLLNEKVAKELKAERKIGAWQQGGIEEMPSLGLQRVHTLSDLNVELQRAAGSAPASLKVTLQQDNSTVTLPVSPVHPITVDATTARTLLIPKTAAKFCFVYPANAAEVSRGKELGIDNCVQELFEMGGFAYFNAKDVVEAINTFRSSDGLRVMTFEGPFQLKPAAYAGLKNDGRMRPVTAPALMKKGAKSFCWVNPGEQLAGSTAEERQQWAHGGIAYHYEGKARDNVFNVVNIADQFGLKNFPTLDQRASAGGARKSAGRASAPRKSLQRASEAQVSVDMRGLPPQAGMIWNSLTEDWEWGNGEDHPQDSAPDSQGAKPASNRRMRTDIVLFKGLVCAVLFALVITMLVMASTDGELTWDFCGTGTDSFCQLKVCVLMLSFLLLFPEIAAMGAQTSALMVEDSDHPTIKYEFLWFSCLGFFSFLLPIFLVAMLLLNKMRGRGIRWLKVVCLFTLWFEALLTWSILPLSYFVLSSSTAVGDLVVNLVAVQFFASIDDDVCARVFRLRQHIEESKNIYYDELVLA